MSMHIPIVLCCGAIRVSFTTSYQNIGVISLNPVCLPSFIHPSIQVRELHDHACLNLMYLFIVVFQKVRCFYTFICLLFPVRHQTQYLYQVSYVGVLRLVQFVNSTRRRRGG